MSIFITGLKLRQTAVLDTSLSEEEQQVTEAVRLDDISENISHTTRYEKGIACGVQHRD